MHSSFGMPKIIGVATANPSNKVPQAEALSFASELFSDDQILKRLLPVFENAKIEQRYFCRPLNWFHEDHDFQTMNAIYIESALDLAGAAIQQLVHQCDVEMNQFDIIFLISTTGISTPSLDARLFNRLHFNPHIKRVPIWGLGCAGGAAGLARAHDYLKAFPKHRALVVAVELCSLAGDEVDLEGNHLATCATLSTIYPETEEVMGWNVTNEGLIVQLSRDIPAIVTSLVKGNFTEFLLQNEISPDRVLHYVLHPGGARVLDAYQSSLGLRAEQLQYSSGVLREFGNMSSCTVLFVLKKFLKTAKPKLGDFGLLASLGPGFCSEMVLLKWE